MGDRQTKILIVEDEPVVLHTLQLILQQHGYDVREARDAAEALTIAPDFQPDTLLCDINLPDIDGIQLSLQLKHDLPHCRVVLLSGDISSSELLDEAKRKGYRFEVLAKPTDPQYLLRVLSDPKTASHWNSTGIHRVK